MGNVSASSSTEREREERPHRGRAGQVVGRTVDGAERALLAHIRASRIVLNLALDGTILSSNGRFSEVLGFTGDEARGRAHHDLLDCLDAPAREAELWAGLAAGDAQEREVSVIAKCGREVRLEASYFPLASPGHAVERVVMLATDVTVRWKAEQRLQCVVDASRDALITLAAPTWRFRSGNAAALEMFGAGTATEFESRAPWEYSPTKQPDGRLSGEKAREMINTALAQGRHAFEWTHQKVSGERFQASVTLTRVGSVDPPVLHATLRDVTAHKETEARIHRLAQVVEQAYEYVVITDVRGLIEYVNPAFVAATGYSRDEAIGQNPRILQSGLHTEAFYRDFWKTLKTGLPWRGRFSNRRKNGELYVTETTVAPMVDAAGKVHAYAATSREVTELVGLEAQLKATFEQGFIAMGHIDFEGRVLRVNEGFAKICGYAEPDELRSLSFADLVHVDHLEVCAESMNALRSGEQASFQKETRFAGAGKREVWAEVLVTLVRGTDGKPSFFTVVCHDISERKRMEVELRHAQKLESIGQLAAGIAHEINTPTQYVSDNTAFLQTAFSKLATLASEYRETVGRVAAGEALDARAMKRRLRRAKLPFLLEQVPQALDQSMDGLRRISKIVGAMREFSHPSRGEKRLVDLGRAVETTLEVTRNEWKYAANIDKCFAPDLPLVPVLADEFNQVVLNIVVNAAHAIEAGRPEGSSEKGTITVTTSVQGGYAVLSIRDTGTGMPEAVCERIFDPFFTTKTVGRGTGQGLAITHSIVVDKHGGRIAVHTELGAGTEFRISLPLKSDASERGDEAA